MLKINVAMRMQISNLAHKLHTIFSVAIRRYLPVTKKERRVNTY